MIAYLLSMMLLAGCLEMPLKTLLIGETIDAKPSDWFRFQATEPNTRCYIAVEGGGPFLDAGSLEIRVFRNHISWGTLIAQNSPGKAYVDVILDGGYFTATVNGAISPYQFTASKWPDWLINQ